MQNFCRKLKLALIISTVFVIIFIQNANANAFVDRNLSVGETWDLGNGLLITAQSIDAKSTPKQVLLVISESGNQIDSKLLKEDDVYEYKDTIFQIASIWGSKSSDMVWLYITFPETNMPGSSNLTSSQTEYYNIWKYKTRQMPGVDISNNSVAVAEAGKGISLLSMAGNRILFKELHNNGDVSISHEGNYLVTYKYIDNKFEIDFLDNKGTILWSKTKDKTGEALVSLDVSSNGKYVVVSEGTIVYLFDKSGKELWSYPTGKMLWGGVSISDDGSIIVAGGKGEAFVFDTKGNLLWSRKYGDYIEARAAVSPNGQYIVFLINTGVEITDSRGNTISRYQGYGNDISIISNGEVAILSGNSNISIFDSQGNLKSTINKGINAKNIKISSDGFFLAVGDFDKGVLMFAKEGYQIVPPKEVTETVEVADPTRTNYAWVAAIVIGIIVAGFFARPYYKRAKLKREMAKTPTDWCPNCHKFTGGAKTCPHCGKETLVSVSYDRSKKVKKK